MQRGRDDSRTGCEAAAVPIQQPLRCVQHLCAGRTPGAHSTDRTDEPFPPAELLKLSKEKISCAASATLEFCVWSMYTRHLGKPTTSSPWNAASTGASMSLKKSSSFRQSPPARAAASLVSLRFAKQAGIAPDGL